MYSAIYFLHEIILFNPIVMISKVHDNFYCLIAETSLENQINIKLEVTIIQRFVTKAIK